MGRIYSSLLYLVALFGATAFTPLTAQDMAYPVPPHNPNQLFYLQRPPNANTLIYELNLENGVLNKKQPIHVYWICYAKKGQIEELTDIQRKYAYGIRTTPIDENSYECYLSAYKKLKLYLKEGDDKRYHIYATVNNKQLMVNRIFIAVNGGTLFKPNIDYVELTGIDLTSGQLVDEKISL